MIEQRLYKIQKDNASIPIYTSLIIRHNVSFAIELNWWNFPTLSVLCITSKLDKFAYALLWKVSQHILNITKISSNIYY